MSLASRMRPDLAAMSWPPMTIEFARIHRDQLLKGIGLLDGLPDNATDGDYAQIQDQMDEVAPDVSRLAFGHKYFSLLFPNKLDDYHSPDLQRFHLLKLLQLPPGGDGRYICAGRFVTAAKEVSLPINHFTAILNAVQRHVGFDAPRFHVLEKRTVVVAFVRPERLRLHPVRRLHPVEHLQRRLPFRRAVRLRGRDLNWTPFARACYALNASGGGRIGYEH